MNDNQKIDRQRIVNWEEILASTHFILPSPGNGGSKSCEKAWAKKLTATHPSELSENDLTDLAEHVFTCSVCALRLYEYKMVEEQLDALPYHQLYENEPELGIPEKLQRLWQFQNDQDASRHYLQQRHELEEAKRRRTKQMFLLLYIPLCMSAIVNTGLLIAVLAIPHIFQFKPFFQGLSEWLLTWEGRLTIWDTIVWCFLSFILLVLLISPVIIRMAILLSQVRQRRQLQKTATTIARQHAGMH